MTAALAVCDSDVKTMAHQTVILDLDTDLLVLMLPLVPVYFGFLWCASPVALGQFLTVLEPFAKPNSNFWGLPLPKKSSPTNQY